MASKNGKLFGKINIVDILAVLVVCVLVVGIGYRFLGKPAANVATHDTYEYVVSVTDVRQFTVDALNKKGDVYRAKTNEKAGTITKVEAIPYKQPSVLIDGTVQDVEVPGKYEIMVTIQTDGRLGESIYLDSANTEIYVGGNVGWYTKWVQIDSSQVKGIDVPQN
ncbi:MAG: DUF4330 domain-containing protein [Cellulosilyticaceae bacterium]